MNSTESTHQQLQELRQLLPNAERLAEMFLYSPISMEYYSPNGKWVAGNHACMKIFGTRPDDVIGFDLFTDELVPQELRERLKRGESGSFRRPFDFSKVTYKTDRTDAPLFEIMFTVLHDEKGAISGYLVQTIEVR